MFTKYSELMTIRLSHVVGARADSSGAYYGSVLNGKYIQNDVRKLKDAAKSKVGKFASSR